ncbi:c-type cytochrome [Altericroceibacterium spongiae]|nr:c-type cytochrome [Altericroceibacterium spongiae]
MKIMASMAVLGIATVSATPALANSSNGETLFKQRCQMCHTNKPGARSGAGPNLSGLSGRTAGTSEGFRYSKKLAASGIKWNQKTLNKFLTSPNKMVPGTRMVVSIPNEEQRKAVVHYLLTGK